MKQKFESDEYNLYYCNDELTKDLIFAKLLRFYKKHGTFNGESICQCDGPIVEAPELLSEIAELFEFEVEYKDQ